MVAYIERQQRERGVPWAHISRHMLGLWNGRPGARRWRQVWSDHRLKNQPAAEVWRLAREARLGGEREARMGGEGGEREARPGEPRESAAA